MITIEFTKEDCQAFQYERYHHPHPHVMRKMEVMHLKSLELSQAQICEIAGISSNTLRSYVKEFNEGGIEKLKELNFNRPKSDLSFHTSSIEAHLKANPPASISQAAAIIEQLTGIKRGLTQTRHFLKSLGFSFRKTGSIPSKAMTESKKTNSISSWKKN